MIEFSPWWEQDPGRLEEEREALQATGVTVAENAEARENGIIQWDLTVPGQITGRKAMNLVATFPEFYPLTRPEVQARDLTMKHHQHPFGKGLCLIGRSSQEWSPDKNLAWLITEQLPKALDLGHSEVGCEGEEEQGEPFSDYYPYPHPAIALVDSDWLIPDHPSGGEALFHVRGPVPAEEQTYTVLVASKLTDAGGTTVAEMPGELLRIYPDATPIRGRWSSVDHPIPSDDFDVLWSAAENADPGLYKSNAKAGQPQLRLLAFPEEHTHRSTGTGWILLIRQDGKMAKPIGKDKRSKDPRKSGPRLVEPTRQLVRVGRAGLSDFQARNAHLSPLSSKRVLLIGAGALGSVIAEQLARAGLGALTVVDRDVLEAGNLARHAATMTHVGMPKSLAVHHLVATANPYTEVVAIQMSVGSATPTAGQRQCLAKECADAHLIIDASAEVGIQGITADLARHIAKPWIMAEATNGALGGTVVRVNSPSEWCFFCFEWHRYRRTIPLPPAEQAPLTQPVGCAEPTFTGAAHDLNEIALQTARTAVAVLLEQPSYDVATVALRNSTGPTLPQWTTHEVTQHPECIHK